VLRTGIGGQPGKTKGAALLYVFGGMWLPPQDAPPCLGIASKTYQQVILSCDVPWQEMGISRNPGIRGVFLV